MNPILIARAVLGLVASVGASTVVGNLIIMNTPANISTYSKVLVGIGKFVLAGIAAEKASEYSQQQFDKFDFKKKVDEDYSI